MPARRRARDSGTLVGRDQEVRALQESLAESREGVAVLEIVGDPGMGKTRLLAELDGLARDSGHLFLLGTGDEFEADLPFGIFGDALQSELRRTTDSGEIHALGDSLAEELVLLSRAIGSDLSARTPAVEVERYRAHRAVRALIGLIAAKRPLVLALDDLHWADPASLELIAYLLRKPPSGPVLLAVSYRPNQASPDLLSALGASDREVPFKRLALKPLSLVDVEGLLTGVDPKVVAQIGDESGGNPYYLLQLARLPRGGADAETAFAHDAWAPGVPEGVLASIRSETNRIPEDARLALELASVLGETWDIARLADLLGLDISQASGTIETLLEHDLVRTTTVPGTLRFRHPIVRRAVYENTKPGWRIDAHKRIARLLEAAGEHPAAIAHHVERSATRGDVDAIALLEVAGHDAMSRAPKTAAKWFAAALRLVPEGQTWADRRLGILVPLAFAFGACGELVKSKQALFEALELLPEGELRLRAVAFGAHLEMLLTNNERAQTLLKDALAALTDRHSRQGAELEQELANAAFVEASWDEMREWAKVALVDSDPADPAMQVAGHAALAVAVYGRMNVADARFHAKRAADCLDSATDDDVVRRLDGLLLLGWAEHCVGLSEDAIGHAERGIAISRASGQGTLITAMLVVRCMANAVAGRLKLAAEIAESAMDSALLSSNPLLNTWAFTLGCLVETLRGNIDHALRLGDQAVKQAETAISPWANTVANLYLSEAWLEAGEPARCRSMLIDPIGSPIVPPFPLYSVRTFELLVRAEIELEGLDAADRWAERGEEIAQQLGLDAQLSEAARARSRVFLAAGRFDEAVVLANESSRLAASCGWTLESTRSMLIVGEALALGGKDAKAIETLNDVFERLDRLGAKRDAARAASLLRRLGLSRTRGTSEATAPAGRGLDLTPRQMEVAQLVAEGRTNREIASQLVLTEKGVEGHLGRIFAKLNISSRAALASAVERSRTTSH